MARRAADRLNERAAGTKEPFFIRIENGDKRDLRKIQAFAQQVDADQDVKLAPAQVAKNLDAVQGTDFGV